MLNKKGILRRMMHFFIVLALIVFTALPVLAQDPVQLDLTASVAGTGADEINSILDNSKITIKADAANDSLLLNLDTFVLGKDVFRVLAQFAEGKIAFSLPDIEDARYEYDLNKLLEMMQEMQQTNGSVPIAGIDYSEVLSKALPGMTQEDIMAVFAPYLNYLGEAISSDIKEETGPIDLVHLGSSLEGTTYSYEPDAEDLSKILGDLADMIEEDAALKGLVEKIAESVADSNGLGQMLTSMAASQGEYVDLEQMSSELTQLYAQLPGFLREGSTALSEEGMGDVVLRYEACQTNDIPFKQSIEARSEESGFFFDAGYEMVPLKKDLCIYFETQDMDLSLIYSRNENEPEDHLVTDVITGMYMKVPVFVLSYTFDSNDTSSVLPIKSAVLDVLGVNLSLKVEKGENSGNTCTIHVTGFDHPEYSTGVSGVTVKAHTDVAGDIEAPSGTVVDFTDYDMTALEELFTGLGEKIETYLSGQFAALQY